MTAIRADDLIESIAAAVQYAAVYHPPDFLRHLGAAYALEESELAREAIAQILVNSRMSALGSRPICQDTGIANVFLRVGMEVTWQGLDGRALQDIVDEGVRRGYANRDNPLRFSVVAEPLFERRNTFDNTPAIVHTELVAGASIELTVATKGYGAENKARFGVLNPSGSVADWVVKTVETLGAGWCPPGFLGIGVGGTPERAMLMAKQSLFETPLDMGDIVRRGPASREEALRLEIYERVNALGLGAQGLGGLTSVLDVKLKSFATHAASLPVALIPQCAANRYVRFTLDGSGPARFAPPSLADWPEISLERTTDRARRVDLDRLTRQEAASWSMGETLLLSGRLLTGRDAAHKRLADMAARGEDWPVDVAGRVIYYVGPVDPVRGEAVGPAGPTTSTRMDPFTDLMLGRGLLGMIGKAERGPETVASIKANRAVYLAAVGGAAFLVSQAIKSARIVAFQDLGMEAIHEFVVEDMPVIVAVDADGRSIHVEGPRQWRRETSSAARR